MKTKLDYLKKEIAAGRYVVGALVKDPCLERKWIPVNELPQHISHLCKRVNKIMHQQDSVDFVTCVSSDLQQVAVLFALPQQADGISSIAANSRVSGNLLDGLRSMVDEQLQDAAKQVQAVIKEFRDGKSPSVERIAATLDEAINPDLAEEMMRQTRMNQATIETGSGNIELGGQKDHVPETVVTSQLISVDFVPTRGVDEKDSKVRAEVVSWSSAPDCLPMSDEATFSLETCNDMQAVKALEVAQLHHKVVKCEVRVGRKIASSRFSLTITKILNLNELAEPSESVQQLLFGV